MVRQTVVGFARNQNLVECSLAVVILGDDFENKMESFVALVEKETCDDTENYGAFLGFDGDAVLDFVHVGKNVLDFGNVSTNGCDEKSSGSVRSF